MRRGGGSFVGGVPERRDVMGSACLTAETDDAAYHLYKQKKALGLMQRRDMTLPIEPLSLDSRCVLTVTRSILIQMVNISTR